MRSLLLPLATLFLLSGFVFAEKNLADFPLKVAILDQTWLSSRYGTYSASGHGNIDDGESVHGFEFGYTCGFRLELTNDSNLYPAKWVKPQSRLKLISAVIGEKNKYVECELKTTVRDEVYVLKGGRASPLSQADFRRYRTEEVASQQSRNLGEYSLNIRFLEMSSSSYAPGYPPGRAWRYQGSGRANLYEGGSVHGLDFSYDCTHRMMLGHSYRAKWTEPQLRLEVLAASVPDRPDAYYGCEVKTVVNPDVYVMTPGSGATTVLSQEEFARRQGAQQLSAVNATMTKLSVTSVPDAAEIEVDGKFVGNTPSLLSIPPGEHRIVVRKSGYKTWEKKLELAAGQIRLNAELQLETKQ